MDLSESVKLAGLANTAESSAGSRAAKSLQELFCIVPQSQSAPPQPTASFDARQAFRDVPILQAHDANLNYENALAIAMHMAEYRQILQRDFTYADWQTVESMRASFAEFGIHFSKEELAMLFEADAVVLDVFLRAKIHSGIWDMLRHVGGEGEVVPSWLQSIFNGEPGAQRVINKPSEEREQYRRLLYTYFDSLSLQDVDNLVEQVLVSFEKAF